MTDKTKKAQVVVAAVDPEHHSFLLLLLQTNKKRGEFWQNITGKVEKDETFEEGALREAIEETGMKVDMMVDMLDLGLQYDFVDQWKRKVHEKTFLIIVDKKFDIKMDPSEHEDYKWVRLDKIHDGIVKHNSNYETLQKACHLLKHWGI